MQAPRIYAFEEIPPDLPRPPLCALRALLAAGVALTPGAWLHIQPENRRHLALEGSQTVVREGVVNELLRGAPLNQIKLVPKSSIEDTTPTPAVIEALTARRLPPRVWESFASVDRWVLNRVTFSTNRRLLLRAVGEIAWLHGRDPEPLPTEESPLARVEIEFPPHVVSRFSSPVFFDGRVLLLSRVAGVRAARSAALLMDRLVETVAGPVELDAATWEDKVLWQAHVSGYDGTFLPYVSLLAATTAAIALCDMVASELHANGTISTAVVRDDVWAVGVGDDGELTRVHGGFGPGLGGRSFRPNLRW